MRQIRQKYAIVSFNSIHVSMRKYLQTHFSLGTAYIRERLPFNEDAFLASSMDLEKPAHNCIHVFMHKEI